ncbi:MAG: hypothetical protein ACPGXX_18585, partial [Planctomycetaceae bacterium]
MDQIFRGFRDLVAFCDDRLRLIGHPLVLTALLSHRLLSHFGQPFIRWTTTSGESGQEYCDREAA